ncbi:MAG: ribonuclease R [Flavobacteriaceae bacterium]
MSKKKKKNKQLENQILKYFRTHPEKKYTYKDLVPLLGIKDTQGRNELIKLLKTLTKKGDLKEHGAGVFSFKKQNNQYIIGTIELTSNGNGYLIPDDGTPDIFIHKKNINRAFDGDRVKIYKYRRKENGSEEGEVVEIESRHRNEFVGIFERQKDFGFVVCNQSRMYTDIFIKKDNLGDYKSGETVVVALTDWPSHASSPYGKIIKSLGKPGETDTEIHSILYDYQLPVEFPKEIIKEAETINRKIQADEIKKRKDFRDTLTFTIDPATAKDFDDALSFKQLENRHFEIGIHIADVSFYVQEGTAIDHEAYGRGTSVYLVDRVVPMLPEVLSNDVCSLRPNEEKYTFSAVFEIDQKGHVYKEWFGRTIILSDQRFTYEEVQYVLDSQQAVIPAEVALSKQQINLTDATYNALQSLNEIAHILRNKRMQKGALSFDRVEINFHLDENNNPESVWFKTSKDAHKLIEEFMLLANRSVALYIGKKLKKTFVYRVHDEPDLEKLENLSHVVKEFGYHLNTKSKNINKEINQLLLDTNGKKEQHLVDTLAIRCMSKAVYSTQNIGHYGLGFDFYTHFTSPIRRYPDVLVHRLLQFYLDGGKTINNDLLEQACQYASQREQLATKAERDSIKYMQVKFMADKINREFEGLISGVTDRGIYVELLENKCEGMIAIKSLKNDYYNYDPRNHALIGERTNHQFTLGDLIKIKVKKADLLKRQLDFELID